MAERLVAISERYSPAAASGRGGYERLDGQALSSSLGSLASRVAPGSNWYPRGTWRAAVTCLMSSAQAKTPARWEVNETDG
jgi:hypothetical protein